MNVKILRIEYAKFEALRFNKIDSAPVKENVWQINVLWPVSSQTICNL